jgi:hypothetical protein
MITLGDVEKAMGLFAMLFAAAVWILKRIEKKAMKKRWQSSGQKALKTRWLQIEKQLVTMEAVTGKPPSCCRKNCTI